MNIERERAKPIRTLCCTCCGSFYKGRQNDNQDAGYSLGDCCVEFCHRNMTEEEFQRTYGLPGIHYNITP